VLATFSFVLFKALFFSFEVTLIVKLLIDWQVHCVIVVIAQMLNRNFYFIFKYHFAYLILLAESM